MKRHMDVFSYVQHCIERFFVSAAEERESLAHVAAECRQPYRDFFALHTYLSMVKGVSPNDDNDKLPIKPPRLPTERYQKRRQSRNTRHAASTMSSSSANSSRRR